MTDKQTEREEDSNKSYRWIFKGTLPYDEFIEKLKASGFFDDVAAMFRQSARGSLRAKELFRPDWSEGLLGLINRNRRNSRTEAKLDKLEAKFRQHLPERLFWAAVLLTLELEGNLDGEPPPKVQVEEWVSMFFLEREPHELPLPHFKQGRPRKHYKDDLLKDIREAAGYLRVITLKTIAEKINELNSAGEPLTEKSLGKVLREQEIDWKTLKSDLKSNKIK